MADPGKTRTTLLEYHQTLNPVNVLAVKKLAQKWASLQLSTQEYLSQLNSLAGRSFHDQNRHPIFPNVVKSFNCSKPESLEFGQAKQSHSLLSGALISRRRKHPRRAGHRNLQSEPQASLLHISHAQRRWLSLQLCA